MATLNLRHEFDCDQTTFWNVFLDAEFNRRLFLDVLKATGYRILDDNDEGATRRRKVHVDPHVANLPAPIKKLVGDKVSYVEEGTFDRATHCYSFTVTPSAMTDRTKIKGELRTEPIGEKKVARVAAFDVDVKMMMIGKIVEEKILADLRQSYESAAVFTRAFLKEKAL